MDITWYGQAMFKIRGKGASVVIDPYDPAFTGLKFPKDLEADVVLSTHAHQDHNHTQAVLGNPQVFSGPGEYEILGITITGIETFHDKNKGAERGKNTIYHILMDGVNLLHLGDLGHILTEEQTSRVDSTDILMIPVGSVYTINGKDASTIVSGLEPKIVIPMHYKIAELKFELEGVEPFLKEMGAEGATPQTKLTITKDKLPEETQVVLLNKG